MYNEKGVYPDTIPLKRNDKAPTAGNYSYFFIKPKTNEWQELSELEKEAGKHGAVLALPTKRGLLITIANSDDQHFSEVYKNHKIIDITKDIGAFQDKNPNASINYVLTNVLKEDERNLDFEFNINQLGYNPEEVRKNKLEKERIIRETLKEEEQIDSRYGKIAISTALKSNWFVANEFADTAARNLTMNEADIIAKKMQNEKPNEGWKVYNEDLEKELEIQHVLNDLEDIEKTTNSKNNTYGKNETENPFPLQEENDLLQNENTEKEAEEVLSKIETASDKKTKLSVLKDWMAEHKQKRIEQKAFDKWADGAEKAIKLERKIEKYEEQLKEQDKKIKEQNELLHGKSTILINGKERQINNGLKSAFSVAVTKLDEANKTIQVLSKNQSINKSINNSAGIEM